MSTTRRTCLWITLVSLTTAIVQAQNATLPVTMSLRTVDGHTVPWQNGNAVPTFEKQRRPTIGLAGSWKKQRFTANHILSLARRDVPIVRALETEAAGRHTIAYADTAWAAKTLPAVENTINAYEVAPEPYEDGVWYRRTFSVPDSLKDNAATLKFISVNYVADVWVNGVYLGYHEGGYTPFAFDVSHILRTDTVNVIAVRVDNPPWNPGHTLDIATNKRLDIVPYYRCDWFNYTGVIHDVYLEFSDPVSTVRADIVPLATDGSIKATVVMRNTNDAFGIVTATVTVYEAVVNETTIQAACAAELIGTPVVLGGISSTTVTIPGDSVATWQTTVTVPAPKLWSPHAPNLYVMKVSLARNDTLLDEYTTQFGVRTIQVSGSSVLLNGREMFYPGAARHEDHATYGRSMPPEVIYGDLVLAKSMNIALLRTAHYPNDPYTYLIADRLGIAVIEEVPVWWFDAELAWYFQNTTRPVHLQMWREMIFKDYNRPSIMYWSTCNECLLQAGRQEWIVMARNDLRDHYYDGRLVTQSAAADRPGPNDYTQGSCDVAGWTMYFGIFHGGTFFDGTLQFMTNARAFNVNKPILNTEFGVWSGENIAGVEYQVKVLDSTFAALSRFAIRDANGSIQPGGCLVGTTWWCLFDWHSSQHLGGFQSMGVYRMDHLTPKPLIAERLAQTYKPYYDSMELVTGVGREDPEVPGSFGLGECYPNPFNPSTHIQYVLPSDAPVTLMIYDLLGREIARLVDGVQTAGRHEAMWNAVDVPSGIYFCRLVSLSLTETKRLVLMK